MKFFYLLSNGEIVEREAKDHGYENMPDEINGIRVLAGARDIEAIRGVRKAIFCDEESLLDVQI
jgi:hypothetical protein